MKKAYTKPVFSCEYFEVNTDLAAGCVMKLNSGAMDPTQPSRTACSDFIEMFGWEGVATAIPQHGVPPQGHFDDDHCDCYYTAVSRQAFSS